MLIPFQKLLNKYNLHPSGVFHVGASTGQEAKFYRNAGIKKVVWIEAIPSVFEELKRNIFRYTDNKAFNICVSDTDGKEVRFNISNNNGESSSFLELGTHKTVHPEVEYFASFQTKTKRIDTLLKEQSLSLTDYDFLNMDLQGAELMALRGMGAELHKIKCVYIEVNKAELYIGCPLIDEIDDYLFHFGFRRVETVWCGNTNWGDSFYIK